MSQCAIPSTVIYSSPLSAVINTRATSFPDAADLAELRSVSLREDVTDVPSVLALDDIAERGYNKKYQYTRRNGLNNCFHLFTSIKYGKLQVLRYNLSID